LDEKDVCDHAQDYEPERPKYQLSARCTQPDTPPMVSGYTVVAMLDDKILDMKYMHVSTALRAL